MSTAKQPQTDGSTEIMNRMVLKCLRCYFSYYQRDWKVLLTAAEFTYSFVHAKASGMTPFEADIGWQQKSPPWRIGVAR